MLHDSLKQKEYCITESAVDDTLLPASIGSKKLAHLLADKDWCTSCVKDDKASFRAFQDPFVSPQKTLQWTFIRT